MTFPAFIWSPNAEELDLEIRTQHSQHATFSPCFVASVCEDQKQLYDAKFTLVLQRMHIPLHAAFGFLESAGDFPRYDVLASSGPDHRRLIAVESECRNRSSSAHATDGSQRVRPDLYAVED